MEGKRSAGLPEGESPTKRARTEGEHTADSTGAGAAAAKELVEPLVAATQLRKDIYQPTTDTAKIGFPATVAKTFHGTAPPSAIMQQRGREQRARRVSSSDLDLGFLDAEDDAPNLLSGMGEPDESDGLPSFLSNDDDDGTRLNNAVADAEMAADTVAIAESMPLGAGGVADEEYKR